MSVFKSLSGGSHIREPFEVNASQSFSWVSQSVNPSGPSVGGSFSGALLEGQYIADLSALSAGSVSTADLEQVGWTVFEGTGFSAIEDPDAETGIALRVSSTGSGVYLEWSETSGSTINSDIIIKVRETNGASSDDQIGWGTFHRTRRLPDTYGNVLTVGWDNYRISRIVNGVSSGAFSARFGNPGLLPVDNAWYWVRTQHSSSGDGTGTGTKFTRKVKVWDDGTDEPTSWDEEIDSDTYPAPSYIDWQVSEAGTLLLTGMGVHTNPNFSANATSYMDLGYFGASADLDNPIEAGFVPPPGGEAPEQQIIGYSINIAQKPPTNYPTGNDSELGELTEGGFYSYPLYKSIIHTFFSDDVYAYYPTSSMFVWNIGSGYYGDGIKPGSFKVEIDGLSDFLQDDQNNNIRLNRTGSVVGTVFYEHGIAVVGDARAPSGSINSSGISITTEDTVNTSFLSVCDIYEHTINCELNPVDYQWSMNPSTFDTGSGDISYNQLIQSGSVTPYITTIGLYNDLNELLAVAKLSKPIVRNKWTDQTFVVKFDE